MKPGPASSILPRLMLLSLILAGLIFPPLPGFQLSGNILPAWAADDPGGNFPPPISASFEVRARWESTDNYNFNSAQNDALSTTGIRSRLTMTTPRVQALAATAVLQHTRIFSRVNDDQVYFYQAYVDSRAPLSFRLGRQEINLGEKRLVASSQWTNYSRSYDAMRLTWTRPNSQLDFFGAYLAPNPIQVAPWSRGLSGLYWMQKWPQQGELNAYFLSKSDTASQPMVQNSTIGMRVVYPLAEGWQVNAELARQTGRVGNTSQGALAWYARISKTWSSWSALAEYNYASGNHNPAGAAIGTFDQLYPSNHDLYGIMDLVGWRNIHNLHLGIRNSFSPVLSFALDYHQFALDSATDSWYLDNGQARLTDRSGRSGTELGREWDLVLNWKADDDLTISGGVARFLPGTFITSQVGSSDCAAFSYLQAAYRF